MLAPPPKPPSIVALVGPSASGKSTLAEALAARAKVRVLSVDDHYRTDGLRPTFDMEALPWPGGAVPPAFAARGNADTNQPDAIQWDAAHAELQESLPAAAEAGEAIVLDGMPLLADHAGAARLREMCAGRCIVLEAVDAAAVGTLRQRKYTRSDHLGKRSYAERGVSEEEYGVWWDHFVWPRWVEHGAGRVPEGALRLGCLSPTEQQVAAVLETGWLPRRCKT